MQGVGYVSNNHRNTIVLVSWYPQCHLLLPQSDLVKLCMVLVEEKCSKRKCKKYPSLCFATTGFGLSCGCFDSLIPTVLCQAKPNYSVLNQQLLKNIIPENFPIQPQLSCSCIPKFPVTTFATVLKKQRELCTEFPYMDDLPQQIICCDFQ